MALYKATKTFSGLIHMKKGEIKEINNKAIEDDLIASGLAEPVGAKKPDESIQPVEADEVKPTKARKTKKADKAGDSNGNP